MHKRMFSAALILWMVSACSPHSSTDMATGRGIASVTPGVEFAQTEAIMPTQISPLAAPAEATVGQTETPTAHTEALDTTGSADLSDADEWVVYRMPGACIRVPVPPGWFILPWGFESNPDPGGFYHTTSLMSPEMYNSGAAQAPSISMIVFRDPLQTDIQRWAIDHSTVEPFGADVSNPLVHYYGVQNVQPTTIANQPGVQFEHEVMGLRFREVLSSHNNIVYGISVAVYGEINLVPIYETMLQNLQIDDRSCPPLP